MDRLRQPRFRYACLYISRKSETGKAETERRSSLFASPLFCITSCFNITGRGIDAYHHRETRFRYRYTGGKLNVVFSKAKKEREREKGKEKGRKERREKEKQTRSETASRGIMNRDLLTSWRKGRFAGRTISNCAL